MTTDTKLFLEVIDWNRKKAEKADNVEDKLRYLENIAKLLEEMKGNDSTN